MWRMWPERSEGKARAPQERQPGRPSIGVAQHQGRPSIRGALQQRRVLFGHRWAPLMLNLPKIWALTK